MTDQQLNEALAKWDGREGQALYPNYCGSLDAVATLEARFKARVNDADRRWSDALMRVIQDTDPTCVSAVEARYKTASATARQRAEALARTVGVWRDEQ